MKRVMAVALVVVFAASFGVLLAAAAQEETWHGIITDDMCGKKHMEMKQEEAKACALKCMGMGGKLALYVPKTDTLLALSDQEKAKEFAGDHVSVKGTLNADGKGITVAGIQKAVPKQKAVK